VAPVTPTRPSALVLTLIAASCRAPPPRARESRESGYPSATTAGDWVGVREPAFAQPAAPPAVSVPRDTWVLHIGDSFVDASFQQNLRPRFREAGTAYVSRAMTATYTTTWAREPKLDESLARRPSMVVVTLGANEVDVSVPLLHARAIAAIARKIASAGASCVWTAPPLWKPDTGIVQVIHDHCAPCLFFDSDAVMGELSVAERKPDRIHPNRSGGARWTDAFWTWLQAHRDASRGPWGLVAFERRE
jgi:lysophospholipase L1-like esterase